MEKLIHFETLGCKLNQVESEGIASLFVDEGFKVSMTSQSAKATAEENVVLCVVNTCTVTAKAEQKARRIIRLLLSKYNEAAVVVTGCYAQNSRKELLELDKRICVLGGQYKGKLAFLPSFLKENKELSGISLSTRLNEEFQKIYDKSTDGKILEPFKLVPKDFFHHSRASLKIQDGCNCVCTYCAIRIARGKSQSLEAGEVLNRIKQLEKSGQSEVVITTVNISQYESEYNGKKVKFTQLLKLILETTSTIRIRISSLYPEIVDAEFAEVIKNERVCPHFHLSVQSGSDKILLKMKRPYKIEAVYKACSLLKKAKDNPFLACDIITGFPGETNEDFQETLQMLTRCGFTFVHAFPFSARPNTEAYKMRPMVPNSVSSQRISELEEYNKYSKEKYIKSFEDKILQAIVETVHKPKIMNNYTIIHAVTQNFLHCQIRLNRNENIPEASSVVNVKILRPLNHAEITGESDTLAEIVKS